jgi:small subunit ribosomal protein S20
VAHSLSAKKRVRQNAKRNAINSSRKSQVKTQVKKVQAALTAGDVAKAETELKAATKKIDKVAAKSTLHKNTAARIKSKLAKKVNALKSKASS